MFYESDLVINQAFKIRNPFLDESENQSDEFFGSANFQPAQEPAPLRPPIPYDYEERKEPPKEQ